MRAELFYQQDASDTLPIVFLSKNEWEEKCALFSEEERSSFTMQQFTAKAGDICIIGQSHKKQQVYLGIGAGEENLAMAIAATRLPPGRYRFEQEISMNQTAYWGLAQYRFGRYKKSELQPRILITAHCAEVILLVNAIFTVRDLINTPTNDMGPKELACIVEQLAETSSARFEQWVGDELLSHNFPTIHAVGRASVNVPRLLKLSWGETHHPKVTLVGKGVCFDSGGLDIKPSNNMRLMKKDMGGAAHAIGLAQWIMNKKLPIYLQLIIPAVENAVGPDAYRPGDVLTMRNGLTVEIDNTDAEGRLVLADALCLASEENPELLIDFATLTGAARTALGTDIAAMFCNDDQLAQEFYQLGVETQDPMWRLPLYKPYDALLDSTIADLSNCPTVPYAGAIAAALFLQRFVSHGISWVHFDIMAWNLSPRPGKPEGGEALTLRALAAYLLKKYPS